MENFNQGAEIQKNNEDKEILGMEMDIMDRIPFEEIKRLFGGETYLIGGSVRDIILEKNHLGDLDLMTRLSKDEIEEVLKNSGYEKSTEDKFSDGFYSVKDDVGVYNFLLNGQEVQVASILDTPIEDLVQSSDINMNCGAFSVGDKKIVTPDFVEEIKNKELRFIDKENVDGMKVLSALKQISRTPDIKIESETLAIIKDNIGNLVQYFKENSDRIHKLKQFLGNINTAEVLNFFNNEDRNFILSFDNTRERINSSEEYSLDSLESLGDKTREEISNLIREKMGDDFKEHKLSNDRLDQVVYDVDKDGKVKASCLFERNRLYCASAESTYDVYKLVSDLNKANGGLWTTIDSENESLIYLAKKAGMKLVNNPEVMKKIILNQYPELEDNLVIEKQGDHFVYYKKTTKYPQVVLISE